ncbi:Apc15p protein-domain-containing protein [Paraphoma chrysanthemicola]|uniref:Apc15p protein-domain-containing protein n=1 Tax=Paraphoma chrysanthemicola TaxID=798071 RepID=A0A8K0R9M7_9PLEO|nr:Apc15p protein-domain-containing protein [Paraphoma chrysanthemicola]
MLSLPMIPPRADSSLWPSHRHNHSPYTDDASTSPPNTSQRRPTSHHGPNHRPSTHQSALLASLTHDENTIDQRKLNVRRFGSGWIRPPGVPKTLQAMKDEEMEKEEQEMLQRREQVMLDLAAAQQDAANAEAREQADDAEENDERDLDDEVPDADASPSEDSLTDSSDESGSEDVEAENDTTVPFNEDSFIEGSMLEAEVSHMLEMEEAEMAGVLQDERDLDDDVPEAGSYEHTDSELEDESDDESTRPLGMSSVRSRRSRRESGRRTSGRRSSGLPSQLSLGPGPAGSSGLGVGRGVDLGVDLGQGRSSFGLDGSSSIMEGSSFLRSSPAATASRGSLRDRFLGAMRGERRG